MQRRAREVQAVFESQRIHESESRDALRRADA